MASIDALYNSSSRDKDEWGNPLFTPPENTCPIANGDSFKALISLTGIPSSSSPRLIAAGFYLNMPDGRKLWAIGPGVLQAGWTSIEITAMSDNMPYYFPGQPGSYDSMGQALGDTIDVVKQAVFVNGNNMGNCPIPGTNNWNITVIESDSDADVYVNQTPRPPDPDASWVQILSALPVAIS